MSTARLRLTTEERSLLAKPLVSWFGDERQSFLVTQIAPTVERILAARVAEFQWNALEMARKADQAERRAEGAEAELERLKAAADLVGHQAACLVDPCDCWMSDLAPLLEYERPQWVKVAESEQGPEGDTWQVALYDEQPGPCDHEWLDRPESDTRECLICGMEATG